MTRATLTLTEYEPDTGLHTGTIEVDGRPMRVWLPVDSLDTILCAWPEVFGADAYSAPAVDVADDYTGAAIGADEAAHDRPPF